ncbi:hypothetical protein [Arenibaculum pallidiluteum]|uniref:hypothetical protein n=1 Tax=Arenibaculum pallidiluteum TaxID=2812559 RepID=UPI001A95B4D1|nr:hypothetical protein [Arenibaculum pallidiluteum]
MTGHANSPRNFFRAWGRNYEIATGKPPGALVQSLLEESELGAIIQIERRGLTRRITQIVSATEIERTGLVAA